MKMSKPDKASARRQGKAAEAIRNAKEVGGGKHKSDAASAKKKLSVAAIR